MQCDTEHGHRSAHLRLPAGGRTGCENRVLAQDRRLERTKCLRRFQPQLFPKGPSELTVGFECLGLPAAAVEAEHELAAKTLPERMVSDHPAQLSRERTR